MQVGQSTYQQMEMQLFGEPITELPDDLYIPPDALWVLLQSFDGPLDLLYYLIRKQNIDICDIPISDITKQYLAYIALMDAHQLDLAADYLVMAAMLAEIKSRFLLPKIPSDNPDEEEEDPRAELVRKLEAYEAMRAQYNALEALPRIERDCFEPNASPNTPDYTLPQPRVTLDMLASAMAYLLRQEQVLSHHSITREEYSLDERIEAIFSRLHRERSIRFEECYNREEGRLGLVVSLLAVLELSRQMRICIEQEEPFQAIRLCLKETVDGFTH